MTISAITKQIVTDHGAQLIRVREKDAAGNWQYDAKPLFTGKKKGWVILDSFTASAIQAIINALNEQNRAKIDRLSLPRLLDFTWKNVA